MKLMVLDGNSIVNRAFFGVRPLNTSDGTPTNAVFGFINILRRLLAEEGPDAVCVTFDLPEPTFRHLKYDGYKATRHKMPEELAAQMPILKDTLDAMNIRRYELSGWEAQDLAAKAHIRGEDYFAILLGWRLPVVDGVQTCREIRAIVGKKTPIIIMSSYEWKMTADEMHKYGVSEFLPKPLFRSRLGELLYSYTDEGRTARNKSENGDSESFAGSRILLVEDNEINREIGVELIGMLGAEVECAENGRVALEMFRDSPAGKYDLIFMDIQMPEMDGFEATRAIRALSREDGKTIPIVAMSANAFVDDIRACKRAGMNAHVPKPVSIQSLAETMSRFLHGGGEPVFDAD